MKRLLTTLNIMLGCGGLKLGFKEYAFLTVTLYGSVFSVQQ